MLCENCHIRSATIHLSDETHGHQRVMNLCLTCATSTLGQGLAGGDVARLIGDLVAKVAPAAAAAPPSPVAAAESAAPTLQCPQCGLTGVELQHLGKLGCAACYPTFAEQIAALVPALQRGAAHRGGQTNATAMAGSSPQVERALLQQALDRAVAEEAFEQAAQIRDSLRRLQ